MRSALAASSWMRGVSNLMDRHLMRLRSTTRSRFVLANRAIVLLLVVGSKGTEEHVSAQLLFVLWTGREGNWRQRTPVVTFRSMWKSIAFAILSGAIWQSSSTTATVTA